MHRAMLIAALTLLTTFHASGVQRGDPRGGTFDVVVYGGTAGGVITAVAAAREGLEAALVEPDTYLGGMVSGGLGWTDYGRREVIGGYSLEFFERVGKKYGRPVEWHFEPHVAEEVFREMTQEAGVAVYCGHRLRERNGVSKRGTRITAIAMENGAKFAARVFADATYEGDLMAQAGVSYTWGREGTGEYAESLAGVRDRTPKHQFTVQISPYDAAGKLLPEVSPKKKAPSGSPDRKVQAYNFRVCMTKAPENRVLFPQPAGYDAGRFALLARMLQEMDKVKRGANQRWTAADVMKPDPLPNGKTDTNNNGAFSTDYIGGSYDYPNGSYATRGRIWHAHKAYVQGFLYFLQNDPQVPRELHDEMAQWGLCRDEFTDTGNWPRQLYVREARRMIGMYVMSQKDIQSELTKRDAIGMGSYNSDSHNVQRIVNAEGFVENEGDMQVPVTPYQIPYRVMLPKRADAINLLVPVCFSATHVAYSTLRMEPQYMIIGHAAGVAANLAIKADVAVQDVASRELTTLLKIQRAVLELPAATPVDRAAFKSDATMVRFSLRLTRFAHPRASLAARDVSLTVDGKPRPIGSVQQTAQPGLFELLFEPLAGERDGKAHVAEVKLKHRRRSVRRIFVIDGSGG